MQMNDASSHLVLLPSPSVATQLGGVLAVSSGLIGWISENHILFSSAGVLVGILVGITGIYVQLSRSRQERKEGRLRLAILHQQLKKAETVHRSQHECD